MKPKPRRASHAHTPKRPVVHSRVEAGLRESGERLRAITDTTKDAIIMMDDSGFVTFWNPAAVAMFGYPAETTIGRRVHEFLAPERYRATHCAAFERFRTTGEGGAIGRTLELSATRKGGTEIPVELSLTGVEIGDRWHAVGIVRDITERKRAEDIREKLIAELDAFAHTVAHDLKNPLAAVLGFAELLTDRSVSMSRKDLVESLDAVNQSARKMNTIIEELLLLAGVRKTEVPNAPVEMGAVVKGALGRLTYMVKEFQPTVVEPKFWPTALGHAPWVEEVWANYLSNAMQYGGKPPRLELGGKAAGDNVRFWVKDNGPGLDDGQKARLFAPFTQVHQVRTGGQGLGLSIVRRIMEKLNGEAWVESKPDKGSRFGFTLPRAPSRRPA
jgi:PAS domain S-box-containing protein